MMVSEYVAEVCVYLKEVEVCIILVQVTLSDAYFDRYKRARTQATWQANLSSTGGNVLSS